MRMQQYDPINCTSVIHHDNAVLYRGDFNDTRHCLGA